MSIYLNAFIRSIIEAITEFLPVSSTGHLFLFSASFPFTGIENAAEFDDLYDIFIQSGAILSVVVLYFKFLKNKFQLAQNYLLKKTEDREGILFIQNIALGSIPIILIGFTLKKYLDQIKQSSEISLILGTAWLIGGILILVVEKFLSKRVKPIEFTKKEAIIVGVGQCIALIPGVSRSAATIMTARLLGVKKEQSAEYSFFLAVPVLILASLYKLYKYRAILSSENIPILAMGFILSFLFCLIVIKLFLGFVKKYDFSVFGYYRILLGSFVIFLSLRPSL